MRGVQTRQVINTRARAVGSFSLVSELPHKQIISNFLRQHDQKPTRLCAPGTFARLVRVGTTTYAQLPRQRRLALPLNALVQLGANAAHD